MTSGLWHLFDLVFCQNSFGGERLSNSKEHHCEDTVGRPGWTHLKSLDRISS